MVGAVQVNVALPAPPSGVKPVMAGGAVLRVRKVVLKRRIWVRPLVSRTPSMVMR